MKSISKYFGLAGLFLALVGGFGYALAPVYRGFHVIPWVLALSCLAVYLGYNLEAARAFLTSRSARYGAGSALAVVFVLGVLVIIGILTDKHSVRYDMTESKRYSLAPQTLKVLENLKTQVNVTGFFQGEGGMNKRARDLLDQYAHACPKFKYKMIDPDRYPARAKAAGVTRYSVVVVEAEGRSEKINRLSEERLTNAVLRVTRPGKKVICFLTGHGEKDTAEDGQNGYSRVQSGLEDQNYKVESLLLMREKKLPENLAVLVVAGPQKDLWPEEIKAIENYLRRGGKVLFLIDPETVPGLAGFLTRFNVRLGRDMIIDKMGRLFGGSDLMPIVARYAKHPVTDNFKTTSFFPTARSVSVTKKKNEGVSALALAFTGKQAWAETNLIELKNGRARPVKGEDELGPVAVAVVGTVKLEGLEKDNPKAPRPQVQVKPEKEGKFIVFGDSDFASNTYLNLQGNGDLFMSAVSWLAEEADLVAIRPKEKKSQPLMLSRLEARFIFWAPVAAMPLIVLVIGAAVLLGRRRRP